MTSSLCETCRWMREVTTPKGSRFLLCELSKTNPAYAKYQPFRQNSATTLLVFFTSGVQVLAQISGTLPCSDEFCIERIVKFPRQHLLFFASHDRISFKLGHFAGIFPTNFTAR